MSRERYLFAGEPSTGKTRAMVDLAVRALGKGRNVFFMSCEDGIERFLPTFKDCIVTDPHVNGELVENGPPHFFLYHTETMPLAHAAFIDTVKRWQKGDWWMCDRADMLWDESQTYVRLMSEGINRNELAFDLLERRIENRKDSIASALKQVTDMENNELDWGRVKDVVKSIVFTPTGGTEGRLREINCVVSAGCKFPSDREFSDPKRKARLEKDDRYMKRFGMKIEGHPQMPSWFDSTFVFDYDERGNYIINSFKDRERKMFVNQVVGQQDGFVELYNALQGQEIL